MEGGGESIESTIHTNRSVEMHEVGGLDSLRYDTPDVMAEYKRDGEVLPEYEYNPQNLLPDDIYVVQQGSVNHPDYEYFTGGIDDEFDQIWEEDE